MMGSEHDVGATLVVALLADATCRKGDHKGRPYSRQCWRTFNPFRIAENDRVGASAAFSPFKSASENGEERGPWGATSAASLGACDACSLPGTGERTGCGGSQRNTPISDISNGSRSCSGGRTSCSH